MSAKYDKSIEISHEEEGTYHRREVEPAHYTSKPVTTYHTERYLVEDESRPVVKHKSPSSSRLGGGGRALTAAYSSDEADNFEEWTTSKRKVNHKTRQVETRVSRQLLVENGKVIADSGPQVTTRIKEDNKVEECEKEKTPKNKGKFEALKNAPEGPEGACLGRVLGEKREIQQVSREVREENMQYHDERFQELTGRDVHQRAIKAPHELITINDKHHSADSAPRGKMVHYSNKGKKYKDTDEILEVAKLAIDGSITKEVKRTHNHEEISEDEKPDEKGEADELRQKPIVQRSSRRHADYVNDYDDLRTPDTSDNDEREEYDSRGKPIAKSGRLTGGGASRRRAAAAAASRDEDSDPAFPRYKLDPLLNSLRDEDFKRAPNFDDSSSYRAHHHQQSHQNGSGQRHVKEHTLERRRHGHGGTSSSDNDHDHDHDNMTRRHERYDLFKRAHSPAVTSGGGGGGHNNQVEIPEEYRKNRQRLLASKSGGHVPPPVRSGSQKHSSSASHGRNLQRKEDAAVQAHLTDEEIERQSLHSSLSGGARTHAKTTQHLQRQSTPNASRRYYYGNAATANGKQRSKGATTMTRRRNSVTSSSSASSLSSMDERRARQRQQGARSRDSGFKSPHSEARTETPLSDHKQRQQQIYSVSSKAKSGRTRDDRDNQRNAAASPTLTAGSAGQRSVKTTTTTVSAGLADRPLSRSGRSTPGKVSSSKQQAKAEKLTAINHNGSEDVVSLRSNYTEDDDQHMPVDRSSRARSERRPYDTVSLSSLNGPNATKIKVPYQQVIQIQRTGQADSHHHEEQSPHSAQAADEPPAQTRRRQRESSVAPVQVAESRSASEMGFQDDIDNLSKRLANISQRPSNQEASDNQSTRHFDYKTVVASIRSAAPVAPAQKQIVGAYNVHHLEQNSPFKQRILVTTNSKQLDQATINTDDYNETMEHDFSPNEYYVKYRATPALVDQSALLTNKLSHDDDRMSLVSSCSLQSSKTYNIRTMSATETQMDNQQRPDVGQQDEEQQQQQEEQQQQQGGEEVEFDENGNSKRPAAWIFDPRDGSTTAIVPPARPPKPSTPDSKTEELVQSRGGRSYYLEILEKPPTAADQQQEATPRYFTAAPSKLASSTDSLHSRWNSHGALNTTARIQSSTRPNFTHKPINSTQALKSSKQNNLHRSTKQLNSTIAQHEQNRNKFEQQLQSASAARRQLPFGGAPSSLGDKSKSSSCLLTVTKPSKYSIYGGIRKPGEMDKPVPRLSYSRAIGPRSQRVDTLPKTQPSRYLKMR